MDGMTGMFDKLYKALFLAYQWIFIPYIDFKAFFGLMAKDGTQRDGSIVTPGCQSHGWKITRSGRLSRKEARHCSSVQLRHLNSWKDPAGWQIKK